MQHKHAQHLSILVNNVRRQFIKVLNYQGKRDIALSGCGAKCPPWQEHRAYGPQVGPDSMPHMDFTPLLSCVLVMNSRKMFESPPSCKYDAHKQAIVICL